MIQLLWTITLSVALAYSILVFLLFYGWKKIPVFFPSGSMDDDIFVSVIVAARNEEKGINHLLDCLAKQDYSPDRFEVIIVDDHSEDNTTLKIIGAKNPNIRLLQLDCEEAGKKRAIYKGVSEAIGSLIVTTDADCTMHKQWLSTIVSFYREHKPEMIVAPVVFTRSRKAFQSMQSLEFLSLVGSGAGTIGIHRPVMCNGANLAFEKDVLQDIYLLREEVASGDDIMLMLHVKKHSRCGIKFLKSKEAIVETEASPGLAGFFQQRKRWVSKSRIYRDADIIIASGIVFATNGLLGLLFIMAIFSGYFWHPWSLLFSIKFLIDFLFLSPVTRFFGRGRVMHFYPALQGVYFFYVIIVTFAGLFVKYRWKGRRQK